MVSTSTFVVPLLGALYQPLESNGLFATQKLGEYDVVSKNLLLVTAHLDDESLFFAPTILSLVAKSRNARLSLLPTLSFSWKC